MPLATKQQWIPALASTTVSQIRSTVEKLLEKLAGVETSINGKCDIDVVTQLHTRLKALEDRIVQHEHDVAEKLTVIDDKINKELETKVHMASSNELNQESSAWQQTVQEVIKRSWNRKDAERRKNNIIIYRVPEVNTDNVSDKNASDLALSQNC